MYICLRLIKNQIKMELFIFILSLIVIPILLYWIREWILIKGIKINKIFLNIILYIHFISLILFIISIWIDKYDLSFRGHNSTSIIFNLCIFLAMIIYLFDSLKNILKKSYFVIIVYGLFVLSFYYFLFFTIDNHNIYYNDKNYRLETTYKGIMAHATLPDLFVKKGLLEKKYSLSGKYLIKENIDSIKVLDLKDTIEIQFYHNEKDLRKVNPFITKVGK